ncbi:formyltransferase family protein [Thermodesulfobacteriota bacterium]
MIKTTLLVDNPDSWIVPYAYEIKKNAPGVFDISIVHDSREVAEGEILFLIGCVKIISKETLGLNKHNLVIHESDLPKGRGWSPVSWQILEGKNEIPIVLFEADEKLDAGPIYLKDYITLDGTELLDEIKLKQGEKTIELALRFLQKYPDIESKAQVDIPPTFYDKRTAKDDRLDIEKSIRDNFNHLRIVHNEKYPAWFEYKGKEYILKIYEK